MMKEDCSFVINANEDGVGGGRIVVKKGKVEPKQNWGRFFGNLSRVLNEYILLVLKEEMDELTPSALRKELEADSFSKQLIALKSKLALFKSVTRGEIELRRFPIVDQL